MSVNYRFMIVSTTHHYITFSSSCIFPQFHSFCNWAATLRISSPWQSSWKNIPYSVLLHSHRPVLVFGDWFQCHADKTVPSEVTGEVAIIYNRLHSVFSLLLLCQWTHSSMSATAWNSLISSHDAEPSKFSFCITNCFFFTSLIAVSSYPLNVEIL